MPNTTIKDLLDAGVHFGHQTQRWNPKMKRFIFEERNGIYIIDLSKTFAQLQAACDFLAKEVNSGGSVLFVGTKKQAQEAVKEVAQKCGMFYVTERWLGGTLTNLSTIRKSVSRLKFLDGLEKDGRMAQLPKKEVAALRRESAKLHKNLDGIANMDKLPSALFVVDTKREEIAVREAKRLKIPVVAIVDTNADPDEVDFPIAGNDDAIRSIRLIVTAVADDVMQARMEYEKRRPKRSRKLDEGASQEAATTPAPENVPAEAPVAEAGAQVTA